MSRLVAHRSTDNTNSDAVTGTSVVNTQVADILSIADQGNNIWRYSLSGLVNLNNLSIGNYATFSGCTSAANDGSFRVEALSQTNKTIDIRNPSGVAQGAQDGEITIVWNLHALNVNSINDPSEETVVSMSHNVEGRSDRLAITDASAVEVITGSAVLSGREAIIVRNVGGDNVYLGFSNALAPGSSVTDATADSFVLKVDDSIEIDLGPNITLYAKCATGETATVHVIELS